MQIIQITVQNYKSLKNVSLPLRQLTLIVGANAAGKSNLADCIDFISEVYRHGLEVAVGRKGGYENIAFRRARRSKSPISVKIAVQISSSEITPHFTERRKEKVDYEYRIQHDFSFVTRGYSIRADFQIVSEVVEISLQKNGEWSSILRVERRQGSTPLIVRTKSKNDIAAVTNFLGRQFAMDWSNWTSFVSSAPLSSNELLLSFLSRLSGGFRTFRQVAEGIRVFQLSPTKSREDGVPTPRPELDRLGSNLPAVVDVMQKSYPGEWKLVLQTMKKILPDLSRIDVDYTPTRRLGLFFKERELGRPWNVDEVSDGTIQTLGILVALFDPKYRILVIEEPENSIHPWIIRHILDACKQASLRKQLIITTHSPIVINSIRPEDVSVIWRAKGETHIQELNKLDTNFLSMWEQGDIPTFEYLDSGVLTQAIPPTTREEEE